MKIGVFDTGYGGEIVAERLKSHLPEHEYIVVNDRANLPYGNLSGNEIRLLTNHAIYPLLQNCPIIVVACNTATAHAIEWLRHAYPDTVFVGFEPMIKPARKLTVTNHITICATKATLSSERYLQLVEQYATDLKIDTPNTDNWAQMIENHQTDQIVLSEIDQSIQRGSDVVILACTHYLALENALRIKWPHISVIEPTKAVVDRNKQLTASLL